MSTYSICFSPTGGTQKVANYIFDSWSVDSSIDLSIPDADYGAYSFTKDDICLIAVPSFGGRVPNIALERLRKIKTNKAIAILVAVYGNRAYDDTLLELKNEAKACGFQTVAAIGAVAEHSIMHQYAKDRPDTNDIEELKKFGLQLKQWFSVEKTRNEVVVPGKYPYKDYKGVPLKPKAEKTCTQCGICAALCPVEAIPKDDPSETDHDCCISCMRCISVCPAKARTLDDTMLSMTIERLKEACTEHKANELFFSNTK